MQALSYHEASCACSASGPALTMQALSYHEASCACSASGPALTMQTLNCHEASRPASRGSSRSPLLLHECCCLDGFAVLPVPNRVLRPVAAWAVLGGGISTLFFAPAGLTPLSLCSACPAAASPTDQPDSGTVKEEDSPGQREDGEGASGRAGGQQGAVSQQGPAVTTSITGQLGGIAIKQEDCRHESENGEEPVVDFQVGRNKHAGSSDDPGSTRLFEMLKLDPGLRSKSEASPPAASALKMAPVFSLADPGLEGKWQLGGSQQAASVPHAGEAIWTKFKCAECGKRFGERRGLVQHLQVHSDVKLFQCGQCGKTFERVDDLARHEGVHTGRFACGACGKKFGSEEHLLEHERTHTVEKSFYRE